MNMGYCIQNNTLNVLVIHHNSFDYNFHKEVVDENYEQCKVHR